MNGLVTLKFNRPIKPLEHATNLLTNSSIFQVGILPTPASVEDHCTQGNVSNWFITGITPTRLTIHLEFVNPSQVSMCESRDKLSVVFLDGSYFIDANSLKTLPDNTQATKALPQ
jgi:hypothetical protein